MESVIKFDPHSRKTLERDTRARSNMCWTCQSCITECPVNIATNRLNPMKIIRMANLGLMDELLSEPSIWYCQSCDRCNHVCPMIVKPADLIGFVREEMLRRGLVSLEAFSRFHELFRRFQRVRWHAANNCLNKNELSFSKTLWERMLRTPIKPTNGTILLNSVLPSESSIIKAIKETNSLSCFSCSGCSGSCPVFYERSVFDPQWIFRMVNIGLSEELLSSPNIWLCLGCERCTNNCSQLVRGHIIIQRLCVLSIERGFVPLYFKARLEEMDKKIYPYLLDEIDDLFGFRNSSGSYLTKRAA